MDRAAALAQERLGGRPLEMLVFDGTSASRELKAAILAADALLASAAPAKGHDPVLSVFEDEIAQAVEEMTEGLGDSNLRVIVVRRLQGYTDREIGDELGMAERTVIRKRKRIQAIWQEDLLD